MMEDLLDELLLLELPLLDPWDDPREMLAMVLMEVFSSFRSVLSSSDPPSAKDGDAKGLADLGSLEAPAFFAVNIFRFLSPLALALRG